MTLRPSTLDFVDTHCHLQFDKLAKNLERVIKDAKNVGVTKLLCVGTTVNDSQTAINVAAGHKNVWATVGIHPHGSKDFFEQEGAAEKLKKLFDQPKVVAVGEIGLDFYKNYSPPADQEKLLRLQIELGLPTGLPFVFHVREAWTDFWRIYDSYPKMHGVIHSFSATPQQLDEALSRGLYVALNGIMTFTDDQAQLEAAKIVPKDKLLLETDAPFLTPEAQRGKVCEPKHVRDIAQFLADLRSESVEQLAKTTTANALRLFKLN